MAKLTKAQRDVLEVLAAVGDWCDGGNKTSLEAHTVHSGAADAIVAREYYAHPDYKTVLHSERRAGGRIVASYKITEKGRKLL